MNSERHRIVIDTSELACRLIETVYGVERPHADAAECLQDIGRELGEPWLAAANMAVLYVLEQLPAAVVTVTVADNGRPN